MATHSDTPLKFWFSKDNNPLIPSMALPFAYFVVPTTEINLYTNTNVVWTNEQETMLCLDLRGREEYQSKINEQCNQKSENNINEEVD